MVGYNVRFNLNSLHEYIFCYPLFFFKIISFKKIISFIIGVSNSLDSDQDRNFVWPDLSPNCLQW